jgi:xanthine dehydrogenase/oxidase
LWPVNKPVPKIEGQSQCTGEAEYVADISPAKGELHAAFVLTNIANCDIDVVDASEALVC